MSTETQRIQNAERTRRHREKKAEEKKVDQSWVVTAPKRSFTVADNLDNRTKRIYELVVRGCEHNLPYSEIERRILAVNAVRKWYSERTCQFFIRTGYEYMSNQGNVGMSDTDIFDMCE
jgi:hypothetical protein